MDDGWEHVAVGDVLFNHPEYGWIVVPGDGTLQAYFARPRKDRLGVESMQKQIIPPIFLTPIDTVLIEYRIGRRDFSVIEAID